MSFVCPKCSKTLCSEASLKGHLNKEIPCDKICCGHRFTSTKYFKRHRILKHPPPLVESEIDKLKSQLECKDKELERKDREIDVKDKTIAQMQIAKTTDQLELHKTPELHERLVTFESTSSYLRNNTDRVSFQLAEDEQAIYQSILFENIHRKYTNQESEQIKASMLSTYELVGQTLRCFANGSNGFAIEKLHNTLHQVLEKVHVNKNHPELWNVMISDRSRMNVKFFTDDTDPPSWIKLSKNKAFSKIKLHARELVKCFVQAALDKLKPYLLNKRTVFGQMMPKESMIIYLVKDKLVVKNVPSEDLSEFINDDLMTQQFDDLRNAVIKRKQEVMPAIENMVFQDQTIVNFLQESETIAHLQIRM